MEDDKQKFRCVKIPRVKREPNKWVVAMKRYVAYLGEPYANVFSRCVKGTPDYDKVKMIMNNNGEIPSDWTKKKRKVKIVGEFKAL